MGLFEQHHGGGGGFYSGNYSHHSSKPPKKPISEKKRIIISLIIAIIGVSLVVGIYVYSGISLANKDLARPTDSTVESVARRGIDKYLKENYRTASSARGEYQYNYSITWYSDNLCLLTSTLEMQNGFGAYMSYDVSVLISIKKTGKQTFSYECTVNLY